MAIIAVVVEAGVAGGPIDEIELRIVRAGHPACTATMLGLLSLPCFGTGLAGIGYRPESPCFLAGRCVVCSDESAHAFITPGGAGDQEIAHDERRGRSIVVLMPVRHFGFPEKLAVTAIHGDHVSVVREHEQAVA